MIGLASGPYTRRFLENTEGVLDYVEIAFEQLRHDPKTLSLYADTPLVLHCASLSVAGFVRPAQSTIEAINHCANQLDTPWIGEHLSFILAHPMAQNGFDSEILHLESIEQQLVMNASGIEQTENTTPPPVSLTYTVCPQFSQQTLNRVLENLEFLEQSIAKPLILENPPQYFVVPGSTMSLVDFMIEMTSHNQQIGLLLDLTHFLIAASNMGFDPFAELARLPLERVVEIHISGINTQSGVMWDDHSSPAPNIIFDLLRLALDRGAQPQAITFEYNWAPVFSDEMLIRQISKVREMTSVLT